VQSDDSDDACSIENRLLALTVAFDWDRSDYLSARLWLSLPTTLVARVERFSLCVCVCVCARAFVCVCLKLHLPRYLVFWLWPPRIADADIIFLPCGFFLLSIFYLFLFLAWSQRSPTGCLPYFYTWRGLSANLECRSEMCCTRLAGNIGRKNDAKKSLSAHHRTTLSGYIFASQLRHVSTIGKKIVKQQYLPHMSLQYGELRPAAEIVSLVWGTPANFNGFRVLAALLHGILLVGVSQTAALNRGRHLYSAGRPSRWALAHISSSSWNCLSQVVSFLYSLLLTLLHVRLLRGS